MMAVRNSVFFVAALLMMPIKPATGEEITLPRGHEKTIVVPENPSTGYTWKIDDEGSENLNLLAIVDHGHKRGASMPGAPGQRRWSLRGKETGHAILQIVYQRPWEPTPVETRRISISIP